LVGVWQVGVSTPGAKMRMLGALATIKASDERMQRCDSAFGDDSGGARETRVVQQ
jgi:hypothetical protein